MRSLWEECCWYVIQSKPFHENLAATSIGRLGVDILFPKVQKQKLVLGISRPIIKPLFPSYLFARFCPSAHLHFIKYARGVRRIVGAGDTILPVHDEVIDSIKARIGQDGCVTVEPRCFKPGETLIVREGLLSGIEGVFEQEMSDKKRVVLLLKAIEFQARVLVEKRHLEVAPEIV